VCPFLGVECAVVESRCAFALSVGMAGLQEVAVKISKGHDGEIAPSASLATDLPLLADAMKPFKAATHMLCVNMPSADVPTTVGQYQGWYAPVNGMTRDGKPVWRRVVQAPKFVVVDSSKLIH
jgi:hypothetical protein